MEVIRSQVENCLRYLVENDSYLVGADVLLSSRLAEQSALSAAQVVFGARLARRYQQVLEIAGLAVPPEEAIDAAIEQEKSQAGKLAEQEAQQRSMPKSELSLSEGEEPPKNPNQVYLHHDRSSNEQRIVVEFPYSRAKVQALQPLKDSVDGWAFDRYGKKEWSYPAVAAVQVVESLAEFPDFQIGIGVAELIGQAQYAETFGSELAALEASVLELEREAAMQVAYPYLQGKPLADGHPLYQHQREAVRTLISSQRAVLAHDLGLGKTRSALIAAKSYGLPILVIAPIGLHINWQREAEAADVMLDELISWAKIPEPPEMDYTLIADECHLAQNLEAQRTQAFLKLCEQAHAVFPLTGTPMRNAKPINLFPLLVAIRHPLAANRRRYEERYCAGYYRKVGRKNYVFDASGSSHLDELHQLIKDQVLYKKKEECLDLPPKTRIMRTAEVAGATAKTYEKTLDHLRKEHERRMKAKLEERIQELLTELGEEHPERVNREAIAQELSQDEHNAVALVEMALLRHAGSLAKAESAVELAQEVLDEDGSVVLFTIYRDTADQIAQKLACDVLNGDTPQKERQHMIDQFQVRESRALVCTYGAGGVGITLTAAQTVILVDRPWTPGDTIQAEDRIYRIGQKGAVTSFWLQFDGLDLRIDALLQQKQERIDQVLLGKRATVGGVPSVRGLATEIMTSVYNDTPVEEFLVQHGLALPDNDELLAEQTLSTPESTTRQHRHRPQNGLRKDGNRDHRVKGSAPRQRIDIKLDPEIIGFLRTLKAENKNTAKEPGYSGFLEELVRQSDAFQHWQQEDQ